MKNRSGLFEMAFWVLNATSLVFVEVFFRTVTLNFSTNFFLLITTLLIMYLLGIVMVYFALPSEGGVRKASRAISLGVVALLAVRLWFVLVP